MVCDTFAQLEEKEMSDSLPTPVTLIYSICNVIALQIDFSDKLNDFYINEAKKIVGRLDKANKLKNEWKIKKDIWTFKNMDTN